MLGASAPSDVTVSCPSLEGASSDACLRCCDAGSELIADPMGAFFDDVRGGRESPSNSDAMLSGASELLE